MAMSEEQKAKMAAGRAKAKAAREAAFAAATPPFPGEESLPPTPGAKKQIVVDEDILHRLMSEIDALKAAQTTPITPEAALETTAQMPSSNAVMTPNGVQGIQYRYPTEKSFYPDPTDRLKNEPSLKRFAMDENFIFVWDVEGVIYEKYNITYSEPRFIVELYRRMFDDEGNDTGRKAFINRVYMQEDELVARIAADKLGLGDTFATHEEMMNEMRYLRMKDWLMSIFNPPKIVSRAASTMTVIIDGKPVEISDNEEFTTGEGGKSQAETIKRQVQY